MAQQFLYLLENPKVREQIGQAAFRTAQDFEFKKLIKNYALVYQARVKTL
jgi:glycosyltransferase involved in cell wall biosynthesis